jgi:hypothetical protein
MFSIIAKPLRRQSQRSHSSFAVAHRRSEPLRSNVSDYLPVSQKPDQAVTRSRINALRW